MRREDTLLDLKIKISQLFAVDPKEFVLKPYTSLREYKNLSSKLYELGLKTGNCVRVVRGS